MRIELTDKAKAGLVDESDRTGMTQVALMSRLVEWYYNQPETIKALVLNHIPGAYLKDFIYKLAENLPRK